MNFFRQLLHTFSSEAQLLLASIFLFFVFLVAVYCLEDYWFRTVKLAPDKNGTLAEYDTETALTFELYDQWAINHNKMVFEWHTRSTKIIFWVSILVTATGIGYSFWQFSESARNEQHAVQQDELQIKSELVSLAFKSRSLATFMMFMSLLYLVIYVTLVYPVRTVNTASPNLVTPIAPQERPRRESDEPDDSLKLRTEEEPPVSPKGRKEGEKRK